MNENKYPRIKAERKTGSERIKGLPGATISEFWQWAYSNVMDNAERGVFAEWLVAKALNAAKTTRTEWDKYDILTPSGIRVEVKTSGYIQSWEQNKLSEIIFSVPQTQGWDSVTNTYDSERKRQADIYVFCVHKHKEQETVDPLDLEQWAFYVIDTNTLNNEIGEQKSLSLKKLKDLGAECAVYDSLNETVARLYEKLS